MNHCPSQRPKRDEWHERNRNLEDAATVTGLTISRESWYRAPRNIGCWRGSERPFFYHHVHDLRCGVRPSRGVASVKWFGLSRSRRAAKTGSTINHEIEPIEIAPLCDSEEVASLRDIEKLIRMTIPVSDRRANQRRAKPPSATSAFIKLPVNAKRRHWHRKVAMANQTRRPRGIDSVAFIHGKDRPERDRAPRTQRRAGHSQGT